MSKLHLSMTCYLSRGFVHHLHDFYRKLGPKFTLVNRILFNSCGLVMGSRVLRDYAGCRYCGKVFSDFGYVGLFRVTRSLGHRFKPRR